MREPDVGNRTIAPTSAPILHDFIPFRSLVPFALPVAILVLVGGVDRGLAQDAVLYTFSGGNDGAIPEVIPAPGVVFDRSGNLYGITPEGGANGYGLVYQLTPRPGGGWAQTIVHTFTGGSDGGGYPVGDLSFDPAGNLYGVTGGGAGGDGLVFQLTPNQGGGWTENVLHAFTPKGGFPKGAIPDGSGHLFGTTYDGGNANAGTIFELVNSGGRWTNDRVVFLCQQR
jgi:uncharacterized repeat protein (TIGR03803 family)